jgi:transcriptional regulator with GAF, ATPase, and Fis domain
VGVGVGVKPHVAVARNMGRARIAGRDRGATAARFSRSVALKVLESGEPLVTTSASSDPALAGARSVHDLGLRAILCVPIRGAAGVVGALYLDHRFEAGRFVPPALELVQALADVIGVALEHARLRREALDAARELEAANAALALDNERRAAELDRLGRLLETGGCADPAEAPGGMIGRSRSLRQAVEVARRVAPSTLPVLIEGESGTGKELLARFIHDHSPRRAGPFMALNCGAVPDSLLESELFGHEKGAFTGAVRDHPGLFRAAAGGTVLLDEIGEMSPRMQPRLLRVLQEGEVWPLGRDGPEPVDVRIVAATNRDLEQEVEAGRFRRDLYFRLVGVAVRLPPLRERLDDVPVLAEAFLARVAAEPGARSGGAVRLSREAMRELLRHSWPGNVRELDQTLRRAALLCDGDEIGPGDLGIAVVRGAVRRDELRRLDRELVARTLRACNGNRTHAARALGVSRSTLHRWLARLEIE